MEKQNISFDSLNNLEIIKNIKQKYDDLSKTHLRNLLSNKERNKDFNIITDRLIFDFSHEKLDKETLELLIKLAEEKNILKKFENMFNGEKINSTEGRRVLHVALRKNRDDKLTIEGENIVEDVHRVLNRIKNFSNDIRNAKKVGFTKKPLKTFISIGIGGSYLGGDFVYNALKTHKEYEKQANGYDLRFLANVCPIDFKRAIKGIDFEATLFIVVSKTFTTAETLLNARNCKEWLLESYKEKYPYLAENDLVNIISCHFSAISTNLTETDKFGINKENVFGFWDWVGGRYSIWSAVGALPLSLIFGYEIFEQFLQGGKSIDDSISMQFKEGNIRQNIPIMLGLIGFYNTFISGLSARAILPYSQALCKFPSHIQQLDMESNGKTVSISNNNFLDYECGPVIFGEPGTNGQHSFYQLIHQGRNIACEFIAHAKPQQDVKYEKEVVSNHEELMCNFFAQPDALAYGKFTESELTGIPEHLIHHKTFRGDKPSISLLFKELDAFSVGQLLSIYEHRVATEGFLYDINSFDQWGVELGKVLANDIRKVFSQNKIEFEQLDNKFNSASINLMKYFIENK